VWSPDERYSHSYLAPGDIGRLQKHADFAIAVPMPDHFVPLLYFAGLASAARRYAEPMIRLCEGLAVDGTYTFGPHRDLRNDKTNGSPPLDGVRGDQANLQLLS
jgi:4,5-DOPA dioxygenase extradiol